MVRASEDRLSSLLDLVYDASTDPQGWPLLLDSLRKATGQPCSGRLQLQSIFNKTDTGRQPELVRLLMAALAPVAPPGPS